MIRVYSHSVAFCLETFWLGLGGVGKYLLSEVKISPSGCFVHCFCTLRLYLMVLLGGRKEFLPHQRDVAHVFLLVHSTLVLMAGPLLCELI